MIRGDLGELGSNTYLREELSEGFRKGVELLYNGEAIDEVEMDAIVLLMEDSDYMREYVSNEEGKIIQVNYEQINHI